VAWAVWTIKPTLNRNDEGPGFLPGLFLGVPSMNAIVHHFEIWLPTPQISFVGCALRACGVPFAAALPARVPTKLLKSCHNNEAAN
jgi:hypothetical protein